MARYVYRCPNQSYAISLEMCRARQARDGTRCRHCRNRPEAVQEPERKAA